MNSYYSMQTFWIVIISILVLLGLAILGFVLWYFFSKSPLSPVTPPFVPTPPGQQPITQPLNYRDTVKLISRYNNVALAVCGSGVRPDCSASYNVSLPTSTSLPTQQWRIVNQQNNSRTGPVRYGDQIVLTSLYRQGPGLDLAVCGSTNDGCGINVVAGRAQAEPNTAVWTILGGTTGATVMTNDSIQLRSGYSPFQLLSACGSYNTGTVCGINVSLRADTAAPAQSRLWTFSK